MDRGSWRRGVSEESDVLRTLSDCNEKPVMTFRIKNQVS